MKFSMIAPSRHALTYRQNQHDALRADTRFGCLWDSHNRVVAMLIDDRDEQLLAARARRFAASDLMLKALQRAESRLAMRVQDERDVFALRLVREALNEAVVPLTEKQS